MSTLLPNISKWKKVKGELIHELDTLTLKQSLLIKKFISKHNEFYIKLKGNKTLICKRDQILM